MARLTYAIAVIVGSYAGSWVATLFGAGYFDVGGIIAGSIGAIAGIYVAYKINNSYSL